MEVMFAEHELHNACQVLFGSEIQVSSAFLEYLQSSGIKTAYRQKALETHPDRIATFRGTAMSQGADLFMAVQQAYERLTCYIAAREKGYSLRTNRPQQPPRPAPQSRRPTTKPYSASSQKQRQKWQARSKTSQQGYRRPSAESSQKPYRPQTENRPATMYKGPIPARKLLFGHYLYYSGITSWQTIIKALIWQRTKRPKIGEIGCRFGWLNSADILAILQSRSLSDSFGTSAVNAGFLTEQQLRLLLFQQKRLQKKFGEFFVANSLLTPHQLNQLVGQFRSHNLSVLAQQPRHRTM